MPQCASASPTQAVARVFVVIACVMALADCSGLTYVQVAPQAANGRKLAQPKSPTPMLPPTAPRSRMVSQPPKPAKPAERSPATPIPLPAAALLIRQSEPSCQTTDSSADERQKLDYERQCYRHAEMIVRARLELLQDSIDQTINAVRNSE